MFFEVYGDNRDLTVLTHSLPTRRASDLVAVDRHLERVALGAIPVGRFDRVSLGGIGLAAGGKFHGDGEGLHFDLGGCVHDQFLSIRKGRLRPGSKPPWGERVLKAGLVVGSDGQAAAVLRHRVAASSAVSWP